jgi:mannosyl-oligosaccharide alpha-1,2-mannosidase
MADWDGTEIVHVGSHLECFMGGNWILGGALLNNQTILDYGLLLADSCWNTYASTA